MLNKISKNYDLLRTSINQLNPETIFNIFEWESGKNIFFSPRSIHFDLTFKCTARCTHCKQWTWPDKTDLGLKNIRRIIDIFEKWDVKTITLGGGNPLLHNSFDRICEYIFSKKIKFGIITESGKMTKKRAGLICQYAQWIRFSIDGSNQTIHDSIRNSDGLFSNALENIKILRTISNKFKISINCVVQKKNLLDLSEIINLAKNIGVDSLFFKLPHGEDIKNQYLLDKNEWNYFLEWLNHNKNKDFSPLVTNIKELSEIVASIINIDDAIIGKPLLSYYKKNMINCFTPFLFLVCNPLGFIYPCDYLQADTSAYSPFYNKMRADYCLGNILEKNDILDNLNKMIKNKLLNLPFSNDSVCGLCTRFCQLNIYLTNIYNEFKNNNDFKKSNLKKYFTNDLLNKDISPFL